MIAHLSLKFRIHSEGVQQQETVDSLPKAIRTSISHYLFYSLVDRVYLFQGVSHDLLFQLVMAHTISFVFVLLFFIILLFQTRWSLLLFCIKVFQVKGFDDDLYFLYVMLSFSKWMDV